MVINLLGNLAAESFCGYISCKSLYEHVSVIVSASVPSEEDKTYQRPTYLKRLRKPSRES